GNALLQVLPQLIPSGVLVTAPPIDGALTVSVYNCVGAHVSDTVPPDPALYASAITPAAGVDTLHGSPFKLSNDERPPAGPVGPAGPIAPVGPAGPVSPFGP